MTRRLNTPIGGDEWKGIKGLQIVKTCQESWGLVYIARVNINTTKSEIEDFLASLPDEFEFDFFDHLDSRDIDPEGAYVIVQKSGNQFLYQKGNHHWSSYWDKIAESELVDYIFRNREYNENLFRINKRVRVAVKGQQ